jgi:hypothetical protein
MIGLINDDNHSWESRPGSCPLDHSLLPAAIYLRIQRQVRTLLDGHIHVAFLAAALIFYIIFDYLFY